MPKPYPLKLILKVLKHHGFILVSQKGSHAKYRQEKNPSLTVIVPIHGKDIPHGTVRSILRQAGLSEDDLKKKV